MPNEKLATKWIEKYGEYVAGDLQDLLEGKITLKKFTEFYKGVDIPAASRMLHRFFTKEEIKGTKWEKKVTIVTSAQKVVPIQEEQQKLQLCLLIKEEVDKANKKLTNRVTELENRLNEMDDNKLKAAAIRASIKKEKPFEEEIEEIILPDKYTKHNYTND